ncbi:MAG TPA: porin [Thiobacillus sp.]
MKKSLIALAVAGAVSAPAFAATSNVDVYGVLNMGVFRVDSDVTGKDNSTSIVSNASRLGFKGSEDLGGGLAAIWQIESLIVADGSATSTLANRNTFLGLKGGFGTVLAGIHDTPMKLLGRKLDNFGDTMADSRNLLGATYSGGASAFDLRTKNTIAYVSPDFSGLTAAVAYIADHQAGVVTPTECATGLDCNTNDAWSAAVNYDNGPLMLGAGYEKQNISTGATVTQSRKMWRVIGGYSFGGAKLGALYEDGSADTGLAAADRKAWGLFGNYAMGAVTLKANYLKVDEASNTSNTGAKQYTVGADYSLSKRTTAYALYAKVKNDSGAAFGLGNNSSASNTTVGNVGADPSVFGVGLKHSF